MKYSLPNASVKPFLHLVTALPSEARPLLNAFSLRAVDEARGVRLFAGDGIRLAVTGIGKSSAACGVGYLAGTFPEPAIWLNIGIAGHGSESIGEVLMAHAVHDLSTGQGYFPPLVVQPPVPTSRVLTVDRPEREYGEEAAYDMEAAAFMAAARRFQSAELVHSLKVVSDGPEKPLESLSRAIIEELCAAAVPHVSELRNRLEPLAAELLQLEAAPEHEARLLGEWHFSTSDRRALRRQLRRREVLGVELPEDLFSAARRGRDVVRLLTGFLDQNAVEVRS